MILVKSLLGLADARHKATISIDKKMETAYNQIVLVFVSDVVRFSGRVDEVIFEFGPGDKFHSSLVCEKEMTLCWNTLDNILFQIQDTRVNVLLVIIFEISQIVVKHSEETVHFALGRGWGCHFERVRWYVSTKYGICVFGSEDCKLIDMRGFLRSGWK